MPPPGHALSHRWAAGGFVALLALATAGVTAPVRADQRPLATEAFSTAAPPNAWVAAATAGALSKRTTALPCLTASTDVLLTPLRGCAAGSPGLPPAGDVPGAGVLRLTDNQNYEASIAVDHAPQPYDVGLIADFDMYMYSKGATNAAADGVSFFILDGSASVSTPGAYGGGLGYAPIGGIHGIPGAYLGVGIDELGNFEQSLTDGSGCPPPPSLPLPSPRVGARGPGNGTTGYCLLGSSGVLPGPLDSPAQTTRSPAVRRHVHIVVDNPAAPTPHVTVSIDFGSGLAQVLAAPLPPSPPATFQVGIGSGTGVNNAIHEVANLSVAEVVQPVLTMLKSHQGSFKPGGSGSYTLSVGLMSNGLGETQPVTVTDDLPAGLTLASLPSGQGWDCSASAVGTAKVSCRLTPTSPVTAGSVLPTITVPVTIAADATGSVQNTATASSPDAVGPVRASDTVSLDTGLPLWLIILVIGGGLVVVLTPAVILRRRL